MLCSLAKAKRVCVEGVVVGDYLIILPMLQEKEKNKISVTPPSKESFTLHILERPLWLNW